ncbi:MAG: FecR domain-containing protein [Blastocatellia bacterium]
MNRQQHHPEELLDQTLDGIRRQVIDSSIINDAADRVWARLQREQTAGASGTTEQGERQMNMNAEMKETITGCADYQRLMPALLGGELSGARRMLVEDHTRECLPCRKALKSLREDYAGGAPMTAAPRATGLAATLGNLPGARNKTLRWAMAAMLLVGLGLAAIPLVQRFYYSVRVLNTVVQATDGPVYRVADDQTIALNNGAQIAKGEKVRTAKDAGAVVRLADGSLIEMRERSEFWLSESPEGTTIHLERGSVIVQAAKQRNKHLYVATPDSLVSVVGTIFSVNSGTKGSRVSVIEGEVHVTHASKEWVLKPGDQVTTSQAIEKVALQEEIAWSREAGRYGQMVDELRKLSKEIDARVARPELRHSTRLLNLMSEGTAVYVAIPNLTTMMAEAHELIGQRLAQNPALQSWYEGEGRADHVNEAIGQLREFGAYLGAEAVVNVGLNTKNGMHGGPESVLVLAELRDAAGLRAYVDSKKLPVLFVDDPQNAVVPQDNKRHMLIWINGDLLAATPDLHTLKQAAARIAAQGPPAATPFYNTIAGLYREGAGLIVAADLEQIIGAAMQHKPRAGAKEGATDKAARERALAEQLGLGNFRHFIAELKEKDGKPYNRAVVTFAEARRGVASWLGAPAPMGALNFISPEASAVAAFVVKKPSEMVDDIFGALNAMDNKFGEQLRQMETEHGISLRNDIAAPLGGEFAFAIDGPVFPLPSWKLIFEVYDQNHLQQSLEKMVAELHAHLQKDGKKGVSLEKNEAGGRAFYVIRSLDYGFELNYTFVDGYFVGTPGKATLERALRTRESGVTLVTSKKFRAALPEDNNTSFSALFYDNTAAKMAPAARQLKDLGGKIPGGAKEAMDAMKEDAPAVVAYAYAHGDRVAFSRGTENGPLGLTAGSLFSMPGRFMFGNMLHRAK